MGYYDSNDNYYFKKGLHSYASDDAPIFPLWAWIIIITILALIAAGIIKEKYSKNIISEK